MAVAEGLEKRGLLTHLDKIGKREPYYSSQPNFEQRASSRRMASITIQAV